MAMVMTAADVVEVLELLEGARIEAWVDGGWGVDALLGEQTREHDDLDLTVPAGSVPAARAFLEAAGFATLRDWLPVALALRDPSGREVDLHPLAPSRDGGGDQAQPKGPPFHYGPPAGGRIAGRPVRCVAAETQLRAHLGYPPTAKDQRDVRLLVERFGLEPPPPYA
jgi:lincosamide nucleotidyltransferase A/C/D/E